MIRRVLWLSIFLLLILIVAAAVLWTRTTSPYKGYSAAEQFVEVPAGSGPVAIGRRLVEAGVVRDQAKLDPLIDDALQKGWPLKRIDAILRAVLRAGSYELEHRKDVPGRVVVSEYVDVAHAFVEKEETGMVNAVLDQIARQFRADEFARG